MDATREPVPQADLEPVMKVERAGRYLGLGRAAAYEAARRGDFPTIRCGRRIWVPTAPFRQLLGLDPNGPERLAG